MPEIGEVTRIIHFLRKHLVGKTLAKVTAHPDQNVFGKVGCTSEAFEEALTGKKVLDAKQQGKYFWIVLSSPPHPLMHFGMAGWLEIKGEETAYWKSRRPDKKPHQWPPEYTRFLLETAEEPKCEAAFVDYRRFSRIRLIDCKAEEIRNVSPLAENGPDPVQDADVVTEEWLTELLWKKRIPIKALLLDQANISGIGNWVGDELLYNAKIHPEQYSNSLTAAQISQLHKSIHYVCKFAVDNLADPEKFPKDWLFEHRWGKGKKDSVSTLPNGRRFTFLTVGGRTSCVVPSVQKKTGKVAGDVKVADADGDGAIVDGEDGARSTKRGGKKKNSKKAETIDETMENGEEEGVGTATKGVEGRKRDIKHEDREQALDGEDVAEQPVLKKKRKSATKSNGKQTKTKTSDVKPDPQAETDGRRRSGRVSGKGV